MNAKDRRGLADQSSEAVEAECRQDQPEPCNTAAPTKSSEKRGDVVYTPDWCAKDMVNYFRPSGVVLDPCRGKGAFHDLLPEGSPWCEITDGVDFFAYAERVDWVIGNPPYSMTREWFRHSYQVADNLLYLVPLRNVFSGYGFAREIMLFGHIAAIRVYGTGGLLGFPMGNAIGAFHIKRGDHAATTQFSLYEAASQSLFTGAPS